MKITAKSKIIILGESHASRGPKITDTAPASNAMQGTVLATSTDTKSTGGVFEWVADDDRTIYIGSDGGDYYVSYLIVRQGFNLRDDIAISVNQSKVLYVVVAVLADVEITGLVVVVDEPLTAFLLCTESLKGKHSIGYVAPFNVSTIIKVLDRLEIFVVVDSEHVFCFLEIDIQLVFVGDDVLQGVDVIAVKLQELDVLALCGHYGELGNCIGHDVVPGPVSGIKCNLIIQREFARHSLCFKVVELQCAVGKSHKDHRLFVADVVCFHNVFS